MPLNDLNLIRVINSDNSLSCLESRIKENIKYLTESPIIPPLLEKFLNLEDLINFYEFIQHKILVDHDKLTVLSANHGVRYSRIDFTEITRNLIIQKDINNNFMLLVETNLKGRNLNEQIASGFLGLGSSKHVKGCYRIDSVEPKSYVRSNLEVVRRSFSSYSDIANLKRAKLLKESELTHEINHPYVLKFTVGPLYLKTKVDPHTELKNSVYKFATYAKKQTTTLFKFIQKNEYKKTILELAIKLFKVVNDLHVKGIVHQDLSLANILVAKTKEGYIPVLIDFDYCSKLYKFSRAFIEHVSPEIVAAYSNLQFNNSQSLEDQQTLFYNREYFSSKLPPLGMQYTTKILNNSDYLYPHPQNDAWALGMILYYMLHKEMPSQHYQIDFCENDVIQGLLNPVRDRRLDVAQALPMLEHLYSNEFGGEAIKQNQLKLRT